MIDGKSVAVIVTARGGSKEVPGKNIKLLAGKPLIAWTLEAARRSAYVDRVLVTTDSPDIITASTRAGADAPFVRPAEISGDTAKQEDAIVHAMEWLAAHDRAYDYVMVLVPTTPLRDTDEIDAVLEFLVRHPEAKMAFTVLKPSHSPLFANTLPDDLCMRGFVRDDLKVKNRQELPQYYQLSGSVCVSDWAYFLEERSFLSPRTYAFLTDDVRGHDINSEFDFELAEYFMSRRDERDGGER